MSRITLFTLSTIFIGRVAAWQIVVWHCLALDTLEAYVNQCKQYDDIVDVADVAGRRFSLFQGRYFAGRWARFSTTTLSGSKLLQSFTLSPKFHVVSIALHRFHHHLHSIHSSHSIHSIPMFPMFPTLPMFPTSPTLPTSPFHTMFSPVKFIVYSISSSFYVSRYITMFTLSS